MAAISMAVLFSTAVFSGIWGLMEHFQEKRVYEERIKRITSPQSKASVLKVLSKKETSRAFFHRKLQSHKKRRTVLSLLFPMLSCVLALVWHAVDPGLFIAKLALVFLLMFGARRYWRFVQVKKYRRLIEEALPSVLDLLMICVEAGMSINSAVVRVAEEDRGSPLSEELRYTFHELNVGASVEDAFNHLGERCGITDLQSLATSIIQSERLGFSLSRTLRSQAKILRETIRMRTRETIMKIPVKMIFPIAFFILPAMFVVILGPTILMILENFGSLGGSAGATP